MYRKISKVVPTFMSTKIRDVRKNVEEGLGSIGRLRILRVLASGEKGQTKYGLEKTTHLKPIDVRKHLKILIETGWVKEYKYNPPVYTLNLEEEKTKGLLDFFNKIGYLELK